MSNTRWRFFKLTNLTIFAALLKDIPMGCKDAVLPESLLRNPSIYCLTFERNTRQPYKDNLCLFRALALHLHGNERLEEETSKLFNLFLVNSTNPDPPKFQGVCMDDIASVEYIVSINIFIYDIDYIDVTLRHHKQRYHTAETITSGEKVEMQSLADAGDDKSLEEELQSCRHFLVDSEIQEGRHSVFNFVVNNLSAQAIEEKLDRLLDQLKCAAKLTLALAFILKNIEDRKFRYFYAHENNTLLEKSKLVRIKDAVLPESLAKSYSQLPYLRTEHQKTMQG